MSNNVEREVFEGLVNALVRQNSIKEEIKDIAQRAKDHELDVKSLKAAAKFYVDNNYEEKSAEFARIKETYEMLAD